jgi:hypothetical protein
MTQDRLEALILVSVEIPERNVLLNSDDDRRTIVARSASQTERRIYFWHKTKNNLYSVYGVKTGYR